MENKIIQTRHCIYCDKPIGKYFYAGRFKAYRKTCDEHHGYKYRQGPRNSAWRGGKTIRQGYVYVLRDDKVGRNGMSRYIGEHTIVAERKYGRKLEKDELVHHLNGVRNDNRPENLVIIKRFGHETWTYVHELQERIKYLEGVIKNASC